MISLAIRWNCRPRVRRAAWLVPLTCAAAATSILLAGPAVAIQNGSPDGSAHPYVGESYNGVFYCSGSLISPQVYVTAAHCFSDSTSTFGTDPATGAPIVAVTFDQGGIDLGGPQYFGDYYFDARFPGATAGNGLPHFDSHDVAVVIFNSPVPVSTYAALPSLGEVASLRSSSPITLVGYGIQSFTRGHGTPQYVDNDVRTTAQSTLIQSKDAISGSFLKLSERVGHGDGGVCNGDSGGPDLLGTTNVVLAENSFVNGGTCDAVSYSYRLDTVDAQSYIYGTAAAHGAPLS
jgi:hypothetical protein